MTRQRLLLPSLVALGWLAGCGGGDRYQGMDADALFRMAQNEYADGDYANAIEVLERLTLSFGDWSRIPEARLLLADSYFGDGEYLTARSEYQRFRDRFVGNPQAPVAALGECKSLAGLAPDPERDQSYTRDAITICGNVSVDYAGTPQATEARQIRESLRATLAEKDYLTASHYFRRKQYDPAILYYQFVVDLYPETEFAPRALLGLYRSNLRIGYNDLAEEARTRLLAEYPDSDAADEVRGDENDS